ncbi:type I secretion C-terminal target domain-containing protein, partial [Alishewanella sp. SMS8]|uniref:beta strand repeat-containing protein n=1 Tax=Alishewanella sp. SMS8 TaxID=2994676 RepID=UPI00274117D6
LADGPLTIDATAVDNNGNPLAADTSATLDAVAGSLDIAATVDNTDGTLDLSGTTTDVAPGTVINITITDQNGKTVIAQATVLADGSYQLADVDVSTLADGPLTIDATAVDNNGNPLAADTSATLDAVAGSLDIAATVDNTDGTLDVSGTTTDVAPGTVINITITDQNGKTVITQATVLADGSYALDGVDVSTLADGPLTIDATAVDNNGNPLAADTSATLDAIAGSLDIAATVDNTDGTLDVSGTTTDVAPGTVINITITDQNGKTVIAQATVLADGSYQLADVDVSTLADGPLTIDATAVDNNDNPLAADTSATLDAIAGSLDIAATVDNTDGTLDLSGTTTDVAPGTVINITITDQNGKTVIAQATVLADGSFALEGVDVSTLADGPLTIDATAVDNNGNPLAADTNATLDAVEGTLVIAATVDNTDGTLDVSGTTTDVAPGTVINITITDQNGKTVIAQATVLADGSYALEGVDVSTLADGPLTIDATAVDNNGNPLIDNAIVALDLTPPSVDITSDQATLESGQSATITFTFNEEISGFDLTDIAVTGGVLSGLKQDPTNPNVWTATFVASGTAPISFTVANGSYTDLVGNEGSGDSASINNAPVAKNNVVNGNEDEVITGNVLTNDVDVDGNALTLQSFVINGQTYLAGAEVIIENQGKLTLDAEGNFTFTPVANWSGSLPSVTYTLTDGQGGSSTAALNITLAGVADAAILQVGDAVSTKVGATSITTGANGSLIGSGLSQASIEQALGLSSGFLDGFNPPSGALNVSGNTNAIDGNYTSSTVSLNSGMSVGFNWNFINGENNTSEIQQGFSDFVLVIITAPDGSKTTQIITSSEFLGAGVNGNGTFNFTATQDGDYKFDWVILNGRDSGKDSQLNLSSSTITVNGVTYGDMVDLTINAALTDASESMFITITGIPSNALLTAGIKNADGSWTLTQEQLEGLSLLTPVDFVGQLNLTVTATTTDGTSTTAVSDTLIIDLSQTTNTVTSGNDSSQTIIGTDQGDLINAYGGNDVINAGAGNDVIYGGQGNDTINAGSGNDVLFGGVGNDTLIGGEGADVFAWQLGDQGSSSAAAFDVIKDFSMAQGDVIDLRDLLQGENSDNITNYLSFSTVDGNTTIDIKHTGSGNVTQKITLENVDLSSFGNDTQAIIDSLISSGHLKIDG